MSTVRASLAHQTDGPEENARKCLASFESQGSYRPLNGFMNTNRAFIRPQESPEGVPMKNHPLLVGYAGVLVVLAAVCVF